jgi:hypothetical protein
MIGLRVSGASPPGLTRRVRAEALVSAPSLDSARAWLRITILHISRRAGFPEFTRFFNHDFSWKLQPAVNFSVTIRTKQNTFVKFFGNLLPASGVAFVRDPEVFSIRVQMVELQGF